MKKAIAASIAILAVACLVAPGLVGRVAEREVRKALAAEGFGSAPELASLPYSAVVRSYERGWFGSRATIAVGLNGASAAELAGNIPTNGNGDLAAAWLRAVDVDAGGGLAFDVDVRHGPILLPRSPALGWYAAVAHPADSISELEDLRRELDVPWFAQIRFHTTLTGSLGMSIEVPAIQHVRDDFALTFSGSHLDAGFDPLRRLLTVRVQMDGFELTSPQGRAAVAGIRGYSQYTEAEADVWLGDGEVAVERVYLRGDDGQAPFEAEDVALQSRSAAPAAGESVDFEAVAKWSRLRVGDVGEFADAQASAALRGVPARWLRDHAELWRDFAAANGTVAADSEPRIAEAFVELLRSSPRLEVGPIAFRTQDGPFRGQVTATVAGEAMPKDFRWGAPTTWPVLLLASSLDAAVSAPRAFLQSAMVPFVRSQIEAAAAATGQAISAHEIDAMVRDRTRAMLDNLVSGGHAKAAGDDLLESHIVSQRGSVTINGAPLRLFR